MSHFEHRSAQNSAVCGSLALRGWLENRFSDPDSLLEHSFATFWHSIDLCVFSPAAESSPKNKMRCVVLLLDGNRVFWRFRVAWWPPKSWRSIQEMRDFSFVSHISRLQCGNQRQSKATSRPTVTDRRSGARFSGKHDKKEKCEMNDTISEIDANPFWQKTHSGLFFSAPLQLVFKRPMWVRAAAIKDQLRTRVITPTPRTVL